MYIHSTEAYKAYSEGVPFTVRLEFRGANSKNQSGRSDKFYELIYDPKGSPFTTSPGATSKVSVRYGKIGSPKGRTIELPGILEGVEKIEAKTSEGYLDTADPDAYLHYRISWPGPLMCKRHIEVLQYVARHGGAYGVTSKQLPWSTSQDLQTITDLCEKHGLLKNNERHIPSTADDPTSFFSITDVGLQWAFNSEPLPVPQRELKGYPGDWGYKLKTSPVRFSAPVKVPVHVPS